MNIKEKLAILADAAKYDASCSSSGSQRKNTNGIGNAYRSGICHSFSADGRCISLLKILLTNSCIYDCKYCPNRRSNDVKRSMFSAKEICEITLNFYRRNYIEGLFLSSGIIKDPDYTMEKLIEVISMLRHDYHFNGYIHCKAILGSSSYLIKKLGLLVDRLSCNVEMPSSNSLKLLAPDKSKENILNVMGSIKENVSPFFAPSGQSTQVIIGASMDSDYQIMKQSESLYKKFNLKRVFYSAYVGVNKDALLPSLKFVPLKREHRLYQADFLLRYYHYKVDDLLSVKTPNFNVLLDPKANWAINHLDIFPMEINKASYDDLLRIPGVGVKSAKRIVKMRLYYRLGMEDLKKIGVVIKRAKYFILCDGKYFLDHSYFNKNFIMANLILEDKDKADSFQQLSLFCNE